MATNLAEKLNTDEQMMARDTLMMEKRQAGQAQKTNINLVPDTLPSSNRQSADEENYDDQSEEMSPQDEEIEQLNQPMGSSTQTQQGGGGQTEQEEQSTDSQQSASIVQSKKTARIQKQLQDLSKRRANLIKLVGKYSNRKMMKLTAIAIFLDMSNGLPALLFGVFVLIPVGIIVWLIIELLTFFVWVSVYKIRNNQDTGEPWINDVVAIVIEFVPGINILPATTLRILKLWSSTKNKAKSRVRIIKEIEKQMMELEKQL